MLRFSARWQWRLIKLGSVLVLLLAVAPQVLYLGHPRPANSAEVVAQTMPTGHEDHEQAAAEHSNHCHVGPKGCAAADGVVHLGSFSSLIDVQDHDGSINSVEITPLRRTFALWQRPEKPPQPV